MDSNDAIEIRDALRALTAAIGALEDAIKLLAQKAPPSSKRGGR